MKFDKLKCDSDRRLTMNSEEKLHFFGELIQTCHNLYLWTYNTDFQLVSSNCPNQDIFGMLFSLEPMQKQIMNLFPDHNRPLILTNSLGLMWTAACEPVPEKDSAKNSSVFQTARSSNGPDETSRLGIRRICILGPYFIDDSAGASIRRSLHAMHLSGKLFDNTVTFLRSLPVISLSKAVEYSIMLHYTLTGETIAVSDLRYLDDSAKPEKGSSQKNEPDSFQLHGTYEREQEMLRMLREGDLSAVQKISQMLNTGTVGKLAGNPDRQLKNAILVGIVLFSRAAIEGGLSPELSMSLCDRYFRAVEAARTVSELADINRTMQNDYVRRVHDIRSHSDYSASTRAVDAYIDLHLEEPIHLSEIAASLGYSDYYLSRKYQKETGRSISESIKKRRIERAEDLLLHTSLPVHEIAGRLCFSSPSYFTANFRQVTGMTPAEYRSQKGALL